jgi:hypothetical protein
MTIERPRRAFLTCSVILTVWILAASPLSGQRGWHQGDTWLKWKHDARETYVLGYFEGLTKGHGDACGQGTKGWVGEVNTDQLVRSITDFYTEYPEDRDVYIQEVIEQLGKGLTLEQIHNHPFPRRNPPNAKP